MRKGLHDIARRADVARQKKSALRGGRNQGETGRNLLLARSAQAATLRTRVVVLRTARFALRFADFTAGAAFSSVGSTTRS